MTCNTLGVRDKPSKIDSILNKLKERQEIILAQINGNCESDKKYGKEREAKNKNKIFAERSVKAGRG